MKAFYKSILVVFILLFQTISFAQEKSDKYLGFTPPGLTPQIFAPNIVSTDASELNSVISTDLKTFHFTRRINGQSKIVFINFKNNKWSPMQVTSFCKENNGVDPSLSPDEKKLFFGSGRNGSLGDSDIWIVEKQSNRAWSNAKNVGSVVNTTGNENHPTVTKNGTLYFHSNGHGGHGQTDIFRSKFKNGKYQKPENLGKSINTEYSEFDPFIAVDESYIIFSSSNRPNGFGKGDLYVSYKNKNETWTKAKNLGSKINSKETDYCPKVSPDGKYFFYTSRKSGNGDIYWVNAKIIESLR